MYAYVCMSVCMDGCLCLFVCVCLFSLYSVRAASTAKRCEYFTAIQRAAQFCCNPTKSWQHHPDTFGLILSSSLSMPSSYIIILQSPIERASAAACDVYRYVFLCLSLFIFFAFQFHLPAVPLKAVAEVSEIGNLKEDGLLGFSDGSAIQ